MSEMVERLAKVIERAVQKADCGAQGDFYVTADGWTRVARVAIAAMREPTNDMAMATGDRWGDGLDWDYKAMIDAALK